MGKYFDGLVSLVKSGVPQNRDSRHILDVNAYLANVVNKSALFEFPLRKDEIRPESGKSEWDYHRYLQDWVRLSQENGKFMAMPFDRTAIEDPESLVSLQSLGGNTYRVLNYGGTHYSELCFLGISEVSIFDAAPEMPCFKFKIRNLYAARVDPERVYELFSSSEIDELSIGTDMTNAAMAFMQENFYIMDPENFIIEKESNASRQLQAKLNRKTNPELKPRVTSMRPHYLLRSEEDTCSFLRSEAKDREPVLVHPVRGHWKTLVSEKYKAAKGKRIQIEQYYRGKGEIQGKNGWNYRVFVKEDLQLKPAG